VDSGVIDTFLGIFTRYINSGFGLLGPEVNLLARTLVLIDIMPRNALRVRVRTVLRDGLRVGRESPGRPVVEQAHATVSHHHPPTFGGVLRLQSRHLLR